MCLLNDVFMSKVERVESELRKLSQAELRQVREWLDDIIEDWNSRLNLNTPSNRPNVT